LTPVFYDAKLVPAGHQLFYRVNPMVSVLEAYRTVLMRGDIPDIHPLFLVGLGSMVLLIFSGWLFVHASYHFAEQI
jgi:lipopolysaccharide transport system permease protein